MDEKIIELTDIVEATITVRNPHWWERKTISMLILKSIGYLLAGAFFYYHL